MQDFKAEAILILICLAALLAVTATVWLLMRGMPKSSLPKGQLVYHDTGSESTFSGALGFPPDRRRWNEC